MSSINFSKANCKNCYKCVRECPVKAIRVKNEQAEIVEELCIACGNCLRVCPQNAKEIKSELDTIKKWIQNKETIAVSLAPAFASVFEYYPYKSIVSALKNLGFTYVEETSSAAYLVSKEYNKFYLSDSNQVMISTSCPSSNFLIQKYYPSLIPYMLPIVSPMILHAKIMKEKYGEHTKVVFLGPCLAKKLEADFDNSVDGVLTFDEVDKWLRETNVDIKTLAPIDFDNNDSEKAMTYPINGGIAATLSKQKRPIYKVDGVSDCMDILNAIRKNEITNCFIEMNLCENSCINGPGMPENIPNIYVRRERIKTYADSSTAPSNTKPIVTNIGINRTFPSLKTIKQPPSEEQIRKILSDIGKYSPSEELNCGACGYNSCRDKAKAVFSEMAEKYMCLPYMRQRAEMMSNTIFDNTPGIIFILNEHLEVIELNPSAMRLFAIGRHEIVGRDISFLMNDKDFENVLKTKINIVSKKTHIPNYGIIAVKSIIYLHEQTALLIIMHDITELEKIEEEMKNIKVRTIDMAQEVINKQMRVAQEIASLLGETTAETKVTLTRLKKLVQGDNGGVK